MGDAITHTSTRKHTRPVFEDPMKRFENRSHGSTNNLRVGDVLEGRLGRRESWVTNALGEPQETDVFEHGSHMISSMSPAKNVN